MNVINPEYGDTELDLEELQLLTPRALQLLGDQPAKAAVFDLEQQIQVDVAADALEQAVSRELRTDEVLQWAFIRGLHERMFGEVWQWAGQLRRIGTNIGVPAHQIGAALKQSLDSAIIDGKTLIGVLVSLD